MRLGAVGELADDLDDDVGIAGLGVDVCDADFGVDELEVVEFLLDCLSYTYISLAPSYWMIEYIGKGNVPSAPQPRYSSPPPLRSPAGTAC